MDFDADVVALAVACGGKAQRFAVAEADLQHAFGIAAEHRVEIARLAGEIQPDARPQRVERALLGRREPALPPPEAAHPAPAFLHGERFRRGLAPFRPATPPGGEESVTAGGSRWAAGQKKN